MNLTVSRSGSSALSQAVGFPLSGGDKGDFRQINELARHTGWLHGPAAFYANYGVVLFAGLLLLGWWLAHRNGDPARMARALLAPLAVLIAVALNQPIVHAVNEPRPYTAMPHVLVLVHRSLDASFPSDHATMAGAAATGLWFVSRRLGLVTAVAAVLMGFTRVYVGAHYPFDVLAGLAVGAISAAALILTLSKPVEHFVRRASTTLLHPLIASPAARRRPGPTRPPTHE